ncbi:MAG TPA: glycosyltransferase [Dongiaceae bacterium]|jgi:glycosyltransferase involved in cell wall biosynthesis|nr:glycosyltransferase [Dongiaceae bacterium]
MKNKISIPKFVIAAPGHCAYYDSLALALHKHGLLRFVAMGTRRGVDGLPDEFVRLNPAIGLANYVAAKTLPPFAAESFRERSFPWFDHWVKKQLTPGDHIISSYAYANESFKWVRAHGGKTLLDGGNSHPENFWNILSEEQRLQHSKHPPVPGHFHRRSMAMMEHVDYVMPASSYVANSFLARGFKPGSFLAHSRPVNPSIFKPLETVRPKDRPLTLICTGDLCLRKGTPYLLESFRLVRNKIPDVKFVLRRSIRDDIKPAFARYQDLPIQWLEYLPQPELAHQLRQADLFILPSLEEGMARTACEAMACGLPAILTTNTGANDFIRPGVNGEVVPIRDPQAIADAVFKWAEKILSPGWQPRVATDWELLTSESLFEQMFIGQLRQLQLAPDKNPSSE